VYPPASLTQRNMDIRDFIDGTQVQKDDYASRVQSASIMFATDLVLVIDRWISEIPDGMKQDVTELVNNFYGYVTEFVDISGLMEHANDEEDE